MVAAIVARVRSLAPFDMLRSRLRGLHREERVDGLDKPIVTETSEVRETDGTLRFKLRWDAPRTVEGEEGTEVYRETHNVEVAVAPLGGEMLAFVHAYDRGLARASKGSVSRVMFDRQGQLDAIIPTPRFFDWAEANDLVRIVDGGTRTHSGQVQHVKMDGNFLPTNPRWENAKQNASVYYLRYEGHDGVEYGAYFDGTYIVAGDGIDPLDLERFVLLRVLPNLGRPAHGGS